MRYVFITFLLFVSFVALTKVGHQENVIVDDQCSIYVFAGNDRTLCIGQSLLIQELQATINGDVDDGDWITYGDGRFQPGNLLTVRFSIAKVQQIQYVPGPNDIALGFYRLLLLSDAPFGNPQEKGSDEVKISFQAAPPLFCQSNFTIALDESCSQTVTVTMLQSNPVPPFDNYIIELTTKDGKVIPNNILTKDHVGKEISYKLGHQCTSNVCYGMFFVDDYFPPIFNCKNDTIFCNQSVTPLDLGFPIPAGAWIDTIINNKYIVKDWDKCSDVTLEYTDEETKTDCNGNSDRIISRKWKAKDARGNASNCTELIVVKRMPLDSITFPVNYDGIRAPFFECGDTFPKLSNGYPSVDTTGIPGVGFCGHLQYQYSDIVFEECGNSYKIARNWFVIDWCTSSSRSANQLIYLRDTKGPLISCQDTILLETSPYTCNTDQVLIPELIEAYDCSDFTVTMQLWSKDGVNYTDKIKLIQGKRYFKDVPQGQYVLKYIATDDCNNISECESIVRVEDHTPPYTVCDEHTKVSLDNIGKGRVFAFTFDNGSSDNCAIDYYKVRRMEDGCGKGTDWGDYVDFCCADIGTTQMVSFQVVDVFGNKNTCMVEVNVEDKIKPTIICPPDITLECSDDYDPSDLDRFGTVVTSESQRQNIVINNYYHQGVIGKDGLALDNCSLTLQSRYTMQIDCHTGYIYRTFIATDASGNQDSCIQKITILNPDPFSKSDIIWPDPYVGDGCKLLDADPVITGFPQFTNTSCGNVTHSYTDQNFYLADSACVKIFRTWAVLDWCQFNEEYPKEGISEYVQIIKLSNYKSPVLLSSCQDTTFCSYALDCGLTSIELSANAEDECTATSELVWAYQVDINSDGTIDYTGGSSKFSEEVPMGIHIIKWTVSDQCGNVTKCSRKFIVKDCKKPTPYCISYLTKSLDAVTGSVEISAIDFDKGSTDNCTAVEDLIFTFNRDFPVQATKDQEHYFKGDGLVATEDEFIKGDAQRWNPNTKSSVIYLDCNDIDNGISDTIYLKMSVFDMQGLSDYCTIELILQDNSDVCPDVVTRHFVEGSIKTENNKTLDGVEVRYRSSEEDTLILANKDGSYHLPDLHRGKEYTIEPFFDGDPIEGVTTLDLVLIQRHILGLTTFSSPFQYIAADVDDSKVITASDMTKIRKLILGVTDRIVKNRSSWVFVAKDGIKNPSSPLIFEDFYETGVLKQDLKDIDFVAVKLGDVNYTALEDNLRETETRSNPVLPYSIQYSDEKYGEFTKWTFMASENIQMDALQLGLQLQHPGEILEVGWKHEISMDHDYAIQGQKANILMYHATPVSLRPGFVIFELYTDNRQEQQEIAFNKVFNSEMYVNGIRRPVVLTKVKDKSTEGEIKILNNPVSNQLVLTINNIGEEKLKYDIIDAEGRVYMSDDIFLIGTSLEYPIDIQANMPPGIYFIKIYGKKTDFSLKFIYVK